jgi:HEAT repeat protein
MRRWPLSKCCRRATLALVAAVFVSSTALAQEPSGIAADFKAARAAIQQQLRDRKKETRLAAVKKLADFPTPDAAKLLLVHGLASNDDEVRRAAFDVLASFNGDKEVCNFLVMNINKQWRQGKPQPEAYAALAILLSSDLPEFHEQAAELVKESLAHPVQGRIVLITLADELGNCRGEHASGALEQLAELPLLKDDFAFRRAVVQALTRVRSKTAIAALIRLLATIKGEARADAVRYLTDVSGQQLGIEALAWSAWWEANEKTFTFPPEDKPAVVQALAAARQPAAGPTYYGLPLSGSRIVFVLDTSGSMEGPRIIAAKRELSRAIEELPQDVEFSIVSFALRPLVWQPKLVPASAENKHSALYFVAAVKGIGNGTASYDALETALGFDGEVIYFLTDGAPNGGKVTSPPDIVRTITRANLYRRLTINSLGIGVGRPGNNFDTFLASLAQQNFGVYERVDQ